MKIINKKKALSIYNREKNLLKNAVNNGNDSYHIFSVSTINNDFSDSRMVVLRNIEMRPLKIFFNIDKRSPKSAQLDSSKFCTALFYDQKRRIQIRLKSSIIIHNNNFLSEAIWEKTPLQSRKCYMGPYAPSEKLKKWHPNVPLKYIGKDPEFKDSSKGYINFSHIELQVVETDILELHHNGHVRFKVNDDEKIFFLSP